MLTQPNNKLPPQPEFGEDCFGQTLACASILGQILSLRFQAKESPIARSVPLSVNRENFLQTNMTDDDDELKVAYRSFLQKLKNKKDCGLWLWPPTEDSTED